MIAVGKEMGVEVHAVLNPMNEPTGRAVGNSLEVIESLETLEGGGPADLRHIVLDLLKQSPECRAPSWSDMLDDGSARRRFSQLVAAQGGNPEDLPRLGEIHRAPVIREVHRLRRRRGFQGGCRNDRPGRAAARGGPGEGDRWRWISRWDSTGW